MYLAVIKIYQLRLLSDVSSYTVETIFIDNFTDDGLEFDIEAETLRESFNSNYHGKIARNNNFMEINIVSLVFA